MSDPSVVCCFSFSTTCLFGGFPATRTSWPSITLWTWSTCSNIYPALASAFSRSRLGVGGGETQHNRPLVLRVVSHLPREEEDGQMCWHPVKLCLKTFFLLFLCLSSSSSSSSREVNFTAVLTVKMDCLDLVGGVHSLWGFPGLFVPITSTLALLIYELRKKAKKKKKSKIKKINTFLRTLRAFLII